MDAEIVALKKALEKEGASGIACDIDEVLANHVLHMMELLSKKFGNPENLTPAELTTKYSRTWNVPYWQEKEAVAYLTKELSNDKGHENVSLMEDAFESIHVIHKINPIILYLTGRPSAVAPATKKWLVKHSFPKAPIIFRPEHTTTHMDRHAWKVQVLNYLYPHIQGIIEDDLTFAQHAKDYKGTVWLLGHEQQNGLTKNIVVCKEWKDVVKEFEKVK